MLSVSGAHRAGNESSPGGAARAFGCLSVTATKYRCLTRGGRGSGSPIRHRPFTHLPRTGERCSSGMSELDSTDLLVSKARQELHEEFGAVHPADTIDRLFDESLAVYGGAQVPDYVPALARRIARDRLRALGQVEGR